MAKDKKKKGKDKAGKTASRLQALADNPLVADLVAAALVSTAAALRDPKKARAMATNAQEELSTLAREGARKGSALWQLALDVGREALDTLTGEAKGAKKAGKKAVRAATKAAAKTPTKATKPVAKTRAKAAAKPAAKTVRKAAPKAIRRIRKSPTTRRKPGAN